MLPSYSSEPLHLKIIFVIFYLFFEILYDMSAKKR